MRFEWDDDKNRINQRKHGISFETAIKVWDDPFHWTYFDRIENGERRMHCVGTIGAATVLLVVYVDKDSHGEEIIRIIGARRATRHERNAYRNG
jgi:uncharacterized DUF497 family protein